MKIAWSIALFTALLLLAGCNSGRLRTVPVRGTISYKGKAVPNGTILFVPAAGPEAMGEVSKDGAFVLTTYQPGDGAVPGPYTVVIIARQDTSERLPESRDPLPPPIVPIKVTSIASSPLRVEVKDQENVFDFNLDEVK